MNTTESSLRRALVTGSKGGIERLGAGDNDVPATWPFIDDRPKLPPFVADTGEHPISGDAIRAFLHDGCPIESRFRMPELLWSSFTQEAQA